METKAGQDSVHKRLERNEKEKAARKDSATPVKHKTLVSNEIKLAMISVQDSIEMNNTDTVVIFFLRFPLFHNSNTLYRSPRSYNRSPSNRSSNSSTDSGVAATSGGGGGTSSSCGVLPEFQSSSSLQYLLGGLLM